MCFCCHTERIDPSTGSFPASPPTGAPQPRDPRGGTADPRGQPGHPEWNGRLGCSGGLRLEGLPSCKPFLLLCSGPWTVGFLFLTKALLGCCRAPACHGADSPPGPGLAIAGCRVGSLREKAPIAHPRWTLRNTHEQNPRETTSEPCLGASPPPHLPSLGGCEKLYAWAGRRLSERGCRLASGCGEAQAELCSRRWLWLPAGTRG